MKKNTSIVCLGGGIGTVNLIRGLKHFTDAITVVVSMADEGGSSGRLRRLYNVFPPGDLVSCMASVCSNPDTAKLLTYRFPGDRYGKDAELAGHKLGNLIMVALYEQTGDFTESVEKFQKLFQIKGKFLCATSQMVTISAQTIEGKVVVGEEKIDLGKYNGERILERVYLHPKSVRASSELIDALLRANVIIAGPGDLYTTVLPVLIVPNLATAIKKSKAKKVFVVNIANKPFETKGYAVSDYVQAVKKHLGTFPFQQVLINTNTRVAIPKKYRYTYVPHNPHAEDATITIIGRDLVDESFPLYHSSGKLAKAILEQV